MIALKKRVIFRDMTLIDTIHVCRNEKPESRAIRNNTGLDDEPDEYAVKLFHDSLASWVVLNLDHTPVMIGGFLDNPGSRFTFWMMPSTFFKRTYWPDVHAFGEAILENLFKEVKDASRIEAIVASSAPGGSSWLKSLGFELEGVMRSYGKNGEDYLMFSIIKGKGYG